MIIVALSPKGEEISFAIKWMNEPFDLHSEKKPNGEYT